MSATHLPRSVGNKLYNAGEHGVTGLQGIDFRTFALVATRISCSFEGAFFD
jgi:hypothetical protein